jgi:hypothetical protein
MATNERMFPEQTWYDPNNPGTFHDALRTDYAKAVTAAQRRPSLRRHMDECVVCQAIGDAVEQAPNPVTTRRRFKVVLNKDLMRTLLQLPERFEIVHMYAENDPNTITILVAGEGLPEVPVDAETPTMDVDVARGTTDTAS